MLTYVCLSRTSVFRICLAAQVWHDRSPLIYGRSQSNFSRSVNSFRPEALNERWNFSKFIGDPQKDLYYTYPDAAKEESLRHWDKSHHDSRYVWFEWACGRLMSQHSPCHNIFAVCHCVPWCHAGKLQAKLPRFLLLWHARNLYKYPYSYNTHKHL